MIRERGEPAIADTSKPIIEPPVFPDYPENTQKTRPVADDPDLVRKENTDDDADEDNEED